MIRLSASRDNVSTVEMARRLVYSEEMSTKKFHFSMERNTVGLLITVLSLLMKYLSDWY